jgi:hypothetical protein
MQGPTHVAYSILVAKSFDSFVAPYLPAKIRQIIKWPIVAGGCFLLHGLMDLFAQLTYHDDRPGLFGIATLVLYGLILLWMGRGWIWGRWRDGFRIHGWRYKTAIIFGWLIIDCEHIWHWILGGRVGYTRNHPYYIHNVTEWIWLQIPGLRDFISEMPVYYQSKPMVFVELMIIAGTVSLIYTIENRAYLVLWWQSLRRQKHVSKEYAFEERTSEKYAFNEEEAYPK